MSPSEVAELALDMPLVFLQMHHDFLLTRHSDDGDGGGERWRNPGESAAHARDRLRAEREEAKRRLGDA